MTPSEETMLLINEEPAAAGGDFKPTPNMTNVPPATTLGAIIIMRPLNIQFANASAINYPKRGEKEWQSWAADLEDYGDMQTAFANARPPYNSTI